MLKSKVKGRYRKGRNARLYQGDILKDITFVTGRSEKEKEKDEYSLPFFIIMNQDCDLNNDFNYRKKTDSEEQDKFLLSILVCPAFSIEDFASGNHLGDWKMRVIYKKEIEKIKKNDSEKRYHYLESNNELSIPELVVDFKCFFTIPRDLIYSHKKQGYVASLNELFREELSQRFANYLSRIGLP